MEVFLYATLLQWKRDLRNKNILLVYYIIPLLFWAFMGAVFSSITPEIKKVLIQMLTVLSVSTGAILGAPVSLVDTYTSDVKKAYIVGNIRLWIGVVSNFISALIHLSIVSVIIYILTPIVFQAEKSHNLLVYIVSLLLFMITSISVGTVLGLYVKDQSKLTIYSQMVYLPSLMLSGAMFDASLLPKAFVVVGKLFPATWGYLTMKNAVLSIHFIMPQIIIIVLSFLLIVFRLARIVKE